MEKIEVLKKMVENLRLSIKSSEEIGNDSDYAFWALGAFHLLYLQALETLKEMHGCKGDHIR